MLFCGIEKISLNDFPGKVSCVIFTPGCNFFCPYCHNPQTASNNKHAYVTCEKKILTFIKQRRKFYDGIVISGGEPTLNQGLPAVCSNIKKMGYQIKLDTNGSRPEMLKKLLNRNIVDYIAMDLKADLSEKAYNQFTDEANAIISIKKSIEIIMNKAPDYEFRTTCVSPFINFKTIEKICCAIKGAKRYTLQLFNKNAESILNKNFFINQSPIIPQKDISSFLKIASSMVKNCGLSTFDKTIKQDYLSK